jgi:hypothetical protein
MWPSARSITPTDVAWQSPDVRDRDRRWESGTIEYEITPADSEDP